MIDWFVPAALSARGPEVLRRARTAITLVFVEVFFNANFAVFLINTQRYAMGLGVAAGSLLMVVSPFALRAGASMLFVTNLFALATYAEANLGALMHGGIASAGVVWLLHVPVLVMLLAGRRAALVWAAMSALAMVGWALVQARDIVLPLSGPPAVLGERTFGLLNLLLIFVALAWGYESAKEEMRRQLDRSNRDMQLVLDNVGQGFLLVERGGHLATRHSTVAEGWFGPLLPGMTWWKYVFGEGERAELAELTWEMVLEDTLPLELLLSQLPQEFERMNRCYAVTYRPLLAANGDLERLILVVNDVTAVRSAERGQELRREQADVLAAAVRDRRGFREFCAEAEKLVETIGRGDAGAIRALHTLKGNCGLYDLRSLARLCHEIEAKMVEWGADAGAEDRGKIVRRWQEFADWIGSIFTPEGDGIVIPRAEYDSLLLAIEAGPDKVELAGRMRALTDEPLQRRFRRIGAQAYALADRMGKPGLVIELDAPPSLRLDVALWASFFREFVHVVRNAVDHGIEPPDERQRKGKPAAGRITLSAAVDGADLVLALEDDGRGIDWQAVRRKAVALGLPASTDAELEAALLADGMSTAEEPTEFSGRGIGMGAVLRATQSLGGRLAVRTHAGIGTRWEFRFPRGTVMQANARSANEGALGQQQVVMT